MAGVNVGGGWIVVGLAVVVHLPLLLVQDAACLAIPREASLPSSSVSPFTPLRPSFVSPEEPYTLRFIDDSSREPDLGQWLPDITSGDPDGLLLYPYALRTMIARIEGDEQCCLLAGFKPRREHAGWPVQSLFDLRDTAGTIDRLQSNT
jgi:hypothetical protein